MGDGAFQLLLSAPHRRATPASAAAARTEDGVQRRDIDRKDPRGPGGLAVLWRRPSQSVGPVAHGGGSDLEGPRASVDARSAATGPHSNDPGGGKSAHGNNHHRAAQQSLGQRPHCDGHGRGWTGDGVRGGRSLHDGMRGPSRGQESHAVRGPGAAPAGGARLLRRIPRGGRGRHSQPARPRQPVPERRLPSGDRLPGHAIFAFVRAPTGMQWLRRAVHPHAERAIPVGAHVSERGRVAAWAGGISRALQSALDRPALGVPHARPGSPAASCTWSRCMNTLSSVSKKSGAKQDRLVLLIFGSRLFEGIVLFPLGILSGTHEPRSVYALHFYNGKSLQALDQFGSQNLVSFLFSRLFKHLGLYGPEKLRNWNQRLSGDLHVRL